jgi:hypothetical protein
MVAATAVADVGVVIAALLGSFILGRGSNAPAAWDIGVVRDTLPASKSKLGTDAQEMTTSTLRSEGGCIIDV